jgi:hypothetical protein
MSYKNLSNYLHNLDFVPLLICLVSPVFAQSVANATPAPTILVEIRCKPGTADRWQAEFEKEMLPAIQDVIKNGGGISRFTYMEPVLPASRYDFILIFEVKTFGDLDVKKPWPHYVALARRVGEARSEQINDNLDNLEEDVKVTVMRTFDGGR